MTIDPSPPDALLDLDEGVVTWLRRLTFVLALIVIVAGNQARDAGWLDYRPGGVAFTGPVRLVFLAIFIVGTVVAIKSETIGGIIAGFAAAALVAFAVRQLEPWHAVVVTAAFAVPAVLWILIDLNDNSRRSAMIGLAAAAVAAIAGFIVGNVVYASIWGPSHPASAVEALPDSEIRWLWSGGVTTDRAEIRARPQDPDAATRLAVAPDEDLVDAAFTDGRAIDGGLVAFSVTDLQPDTTYHYAVEVDGMLDRTRVGTFTTFPDGPASFRVAVGGCARVGSNGAVFDAIAAADPLLYLIVGDFHYGDVPDNDRERYDEVLDLTLRMPAQAALYRSTPIAYVWDDHDYGANDSAGDSPSREAAMAAYRANVPSYELAGPETPIYQAFTVGRVRFIMTDARSARDREATLLGDEQTEWLIDELVTSARDHRAVVWVNPVPWVTGADPGADHWGGFDEERRALADIIADNDIDNLVMVSGDAHMLAIDDGTNTDYSTTQRGGFPLIHVAALDRPGGAKGGPYSEGMIADGGQFATLDVIDDGDAMTIELSGWRYDGTRLLHYTFDVPA